MTITALRLLLRRRRCPVPECGHRLGRYFMCKPCWGLVPEKEKAGVWAAALAAVAAASDMREETMA